MTKFNSTMYKRYLSPQRTPTQRFDKSRLPTPADYLQSVGIKAKRSGSYLMLCCPFHGEQNPSLGIHAEKGFYKCFSCDAKGGDLISFHMQLKGINFKQACIELGCWIGD